MNKSFFDYFFEELKAIFSFNEISSEDIEIGIESTMGWDKALKNTCQKLGLLEEYDWYRKLNWDESDDFDCEIGQKMFALLNIK